MGGPEATSTTINETNTETVTVEEVRALSLCQTMKLDDRFKL